MIRNKCVHYYSWLMLILLFILTCARNNWHYKDRINDKALPDFIQTSPFYHLPEAATGDIEIYADFQGEWVDGEYQIDLEYSIDLNDAVFLLEDNTYRTDLICRLQVMDTEKITEKQWTLVIEEENYKATKSDKILFGHQTIVVDPGKYSIQFILEDQNSSKRSVARYNQVEIPSFDENTLLISDIFISQKSDSLDASRSINDTLGVSFKLYNIDKPDSVAFTVYNSQGKTVFKHHQQH
ncbi:hypothetical protein BVY01_02295, partial [bacterium I07]